MNFPTHQFPQGQPAPQTGPMGPASGTYAPPHAYPPAAPPSAPPQTQGGWGQPSQTPPQTQGGWGQPSQGQMPVVGAAQANLFSQFIKEPQQGPINRARPPDGVHVVQFTQGSKFEMSRKDGTPFLLAEYRVFDSTVPQAVGNIYGFPMKLVTANNLKTLAGFVQAMLGAQGAIQLQQQYPQPAQIAEYVAHLVKGTGGNGAWCVLHTQRNTQSKQAREGTPYDELFVNHYWSFFSGAQFNIAQAKQLFQQNNIPWPGRDAAPPGTTFPPASFQASPPAPVYPPAPQQPQQPQQTFPAQGQPSAFPGFPPR